MATIYLIGGTPRVGKTNLAKRVLATKPMLTTSTDALRHMLWYIVKPQDMPGLFALQKQEAADEAVLREYIIEHPDDFLNLYRQEAYAAWPSIEKFINHNINRNLDILLEGFGILPELVTGLRHDFRAVFIGNQSDNHYDVVLHTTRKNPHSWMYSLSDQTIATYCYCYQIFSRQLEAQASALGFTYLEMIDTTFEKSLDIAKNKLLL
jgi:2-phosphoglycerate kinase